MNAFALLGIIALVVFGAFTAFVAVGAFVTREKLLGNWLLIRIILIFITMNLLKVMTLYSSFSQNPRLN